MQLTCALLVDENIDAGPVNIKGEVPIIRPGAASEHEPGILAEDTVNVWRCAGAGKHANIDIPVIDKRAAIAVKAKQRSCGQKRR